MCVQDNSAKCIWLVDANGGQCLKPIRINFICQVTKPRLRHVLVGGTHKATAEQDSGVYQSWCPGLRRSLVPWIRNCGSPWGPKHKRQNCNLRPDVRAGLSGGFAQSVHSRFGASAALPQPPRRNRSQGGGLNADPASWCGR